MVVWFFRVKIEFNGPQPQKGVYIFRLIPIPFFLVIFLDVFKSVCWFPKFCEVPISSMVIACLVI